MNIKNVNLLLIIFQSNFTNVVTLINKNVKILQRHLGTNIYLKLTF